MKKTTILVIIIFAFNSCSPKLIPNNKSENSLLGKINQQIESKTISREALIYFNGMPISKEELLGLNIFELKDFTDIIFLNKKEAKNKFGAKGKKGAVEIKSFLDPKLDSKYYKSIENKDYLSLIEKLIKEGSINKNPLLVVSGKPLRGEEISKTINNMKIEKVNVLKKAVAYQIYGIRGMNGVILIN